MWLDVLEYVWRHVIKGCCYTWKYVCDCDAMKPRNQLTSVGALKELRSQETVQFRGIMWFKSDSSVNVSNKLKAGNVEWYMLLCFFKVAVMPLHCVLVHMLRGDEIPKFLFHVTIWLFGILCRSLSNLRIKSRSPLLCILFMGFSSELKPK